MEGKRFDAWEWMMWLLLCFLGLLPEIATVHIVEPCPSSSTSEEGSMMMEKQIGAVDQDVQVTAVDIPERGAEALGALVEKLTSSTESISLLPTSKSYLSKSRLSKDQERMRSSIGRLSSRFLTQRGLRSPIAL